MPKNVKNQMVGRSASFSEEDGTVEIVYATATRADRYDFVEELVISEDAIDASRLDAGAVNLIMDHMPYGLPLGRVIAHRVEDGQAIATVKLTQDPQHAGIVENIRAGIIATVSVGYQIKKYEMIDADGAAPVMRVIEWMPAEISLVTVPADPHAQIRSAAPAALVRRTVSMKESSMSKTKKRSAASEAIDEVVEQTGAEQTPELEAAVEEAISTAIETISDEISDEANADADGDAEGDDADDADDADDGETAGGDQESGDTDEDEDEEGEGTRAAQILDLCTRHGLSVGFAARHVKAKTPVQSVRSAILDAIAKRSAPPMTTARINRDARDAVQRQAENALYGLLSGRAQSEADAGAFRGVRLLDIARRSLGAEAAGMTDREAVARVMRSAGAHTSSDFDFTSAAGGAIERRVRELHAAFTMPLAPLVRETAVANFLPVQTYSIGGFPELRETAEGAEYEAGTVSTESGSFRIAKFGRILTLSFEAIINDDLRLLDTVIRGVASKGAKLRQTKVREAFDAVLADGHALFHASRGNIITDALSVEGLSAARKKLRQVVDIDGEEMNLTPKFLIVSSDLETDAQRLVSPITAAVTGQVNPFASGLELIVDPVMSGSEWMLAASPDEADAIELADLRGYEGVRVEEIPSHLTDGLSYRARAFAGAHPTGWRGFVKSTGTGA